VLALLRELYDNGVDRTKIDHKSFKTPSNKSVDITTLSSNYHIEINPSDAGFQDRVVVQDVIKSIAQSPPLDSTQHSFKVVVLHEVDKLSKNAQNALRRTMEKYVAVCRLILVCNSTCRVIEPVRSRCLAIRIPAPTEAEIGEVLSFVSKREGIKLPPELSEKIAQQSARNLRKAILMLEATKVSQYPFQKDQKVVQTDWEEFISIIVKDITEEQSPQRLLDVRNKLYELLGHCIPPDVIFRKLTQELMMKLDSQIKAEVAACAAYYEHRLQLGNKPIFHLEAFVAKFMSIYKRFLISFEMP